MSCRVEVPRMLYATQQIGQLETYIRGSGDRELLRWWARYCESTGACGCGTGVRSVSAWLAGEGRGLMGWQVSMPQILLSCKSIGLCCSLADTVP